MLSALIRFADSACLLFVFLYNNNKSTSLNYDISTHNKCKIVVGVVLTTATSVVGKIKRFLCGKESMANQWNNDDIR